MILNLCKKLINEPLVQFLCLGVLLFVVDAKINVDEKNRNNIIVDDARVQELVQIFEEGQGRAPSAKEIQNMMVQWTQNEIFYREGLAMGLDQGDDMIRSRLILKMRNVLFNNTIVEAPSDAELSEYFALNHSNYDQPDRYDFSQILLPNIDTQTGATEVSRLNPDAVIQQFGDSLLSYQARPKTNLAALFGPEQTEALLAAAENSWVPVNTKLGWHLVQVTQHYPAKSVPLEQVRSAVVRDWMKLSNDYQLAQQSAKLADKYQLHMAVSDAVKQQFELTAAELSVARSKGEQDSLSQLNAERIAQP